jgi:hypothetical protein
MKRLDELYAHNLNAGSHVVIWAIIQFHIQELIYKYRGKIILNFEYSLTFENF